jgi:hypothetical protein
MSRKTKPYQDVSHFSIVVSFVKIEILRMVLCWLHTVYNECSVVSCMRFISWRLAPFYPPRPIGTLWPSVRRPHLVPCWKRSWAVEPRTQSVASGAFH